MKECKLYQGQLNDGSLEDVIPFLLSKAKELNETIYVEWNETIMAVDFSSTKESILQDYEDGLHKDTLFYKERNGKLISTEDFGKKLAIALQEFLNK